MCSFLFMYFLLFYIASSFILQAWVLLQLGKLAVVYVTITSGKKWQFSILYVSFQLVLLFEKSRTWLCRVKSIYVQIPTLSLASCMIPGILKNISLYQSFLRYKLGIKTFMVWNCCKDKT